MRALIRALTPYARDGSGEAQDAHPLGLSRAARELPLADERSSRPGGSPQVLVRSPTRRRRASGGSSLILSRNCSTSSRTPMTSARSLGSPLALKPNGASDQAVLRPLRLQEELVVGLDGFYRAYVNSELDTSEREEDGSTFPAALFSSIRPEHRGTVSRV